MASAVRRSHRHTCRRSPLMNERLLPPPIENDLPRLHLQPLSGLPLRPGRHAGAPRDLRHTAVAERLSRDQRPVRGHGEKLGATAALRPPRAGGATKQRCQFAAPSTAGKRQHRMHGGCSHRGASSSKAPAPLTLGNRANIYIPSVERPGVRCRLRIDCGARRPLQ